MLIAVRDLFNQHLTTNYQTQPNALPWYDREAVSEYRDLADKTGAPYHLLEYIDGVEVETGQSPDCYVVRGSLVIHTVASTALTVAQRGSMAEAIYNAIPRKGRLTNSGPANSLVIQSRSIPSTYHPHAFGDFGSMADHCFHLQFIYQGA